MQAPAPAKSGEPSLISHLHNSSTVERCLLRCHCRIRTLHFIVLLQFFSCPTPRTSSSVVNWQMPTPREERAAARDHRQHLQLPQHGLGRADILRSRSPSPIGPGVFNFPQNIPLPQNGQFENANMAATQEQLDAIRELEVLPVVPCSSSFFTRCGHLPVDDA